MRTDVNENTILRLAQELTNALEAKEMYQYLLEQKTKENERLLSELEELRHPEFYKDGGED